MHFLYCSTEKPVQKEEKYQSQTKMQFTHLARITNYIIQHRFVTCQRPKKKRQDLGLSVASRLVLHPVCTQFCVNSEVSALRCRTLSDPMLSSFIFNPVCIAQCAICAVQFLCPKLGNNLTLVYIYDTGEYLGITKMEISPFSRLNEL